jgi:lipopolysaccharide transport system permease protein
VRQSGTLRRSARSVGLNPLVTDIEGFRWSLLGTPAPGAAVVATGTTAMSLLLAGSFFYFKGQERTLADII